MPVSAVFISSMRTNYVSIKYPASLSRRSSPTMCLARRNFKVAQQRGSVLEIYSPRIVKSSPLIFELYHKQARIDFYTREQALQDTCITIK
jgi:hypothetical protein